MELTSCARTILMRRWKNGGRGSEGAFVANIVDVCQLMAVAKDRRAKYPAINGEIVGNSRVIWTRGRTSKQHAKIQETT